MITPTKALYLVALVVSLFAWRSVADDFFKGMRGPTLFQMDNRFSYINQDNDVESYGGNMILKYWDGQTLGKWAFVNLHHIVDLKVMTRWDFAPKRAFLELGYMHTVAEETLPAREAVETQPRFNF